MTNFLKQGMTAEFYSGYITTGNLLSVSQFIKTILKLSKTCQEICQHFLTVSVALTPQKLPKTFKKTTHDFQKLQNWDCYRKAHFFFTVKPILTQAISSLVSLGHSTFFLSFLFPNNTCSFHNPYRVFRFQVTLNTCMRTRSRRYILVILI